MRRWMKERWLAELAALAALAIVALLLSRWLRGPKDEIAPRPEPPPSALPEAPSPLDRARALRAEAFQECDRAAWERCLERLDEAAAIDPAGDTEKDVTDARERARKAIEEQQRLNEGPKDAQVDSKDEDRSPRADGTPTPPGYEIGDAEPDAEMKAPPPVRVNELKKRTSRPTASPPRSERRAGLSGWTSSRPPIGGVRRPARVARAAAARLNSGRSASFRAPRPLAGHPSGAWWAAASLSGAAARCREGVARAVWGDRRPRMPLAVFFTVV
jgi:hypothetical protein